MREIFALLCIVILWLLFAFAGTVAAIKGVKIPWPVMFLAGGTTGVISLALFRWGRP
jgi:hypothetical protein